MTTLLEWIAWGMLSLFGLVILGAVVLGWIMMLAGAQ